MVDKAREETLISCGRMRVVEHKKSLSFQDAQTCIYEDAQALSAVFVELELIALIVTEKKNLESESVVTICPQALSRVTRGRTSLLLHYFSLSLTGSTHSQVSSNVNGALKECDFVQIMHRFVDNIAATSVLVIGKEYCLKILILVSLQESSNNNSSSFRTTLLEMSPQQLLEKVDYGTSTLDLLFVQDATASQGPYIDSAKESILEICHLLKGSKRLREEDGLQVGLIAYRDYDQSGYQEEFLTKSYGFTYDLNKMKSILSELKPAGGGDGPEALGAALDLALSMDGWREDSVKVVVVITDAPPHGLGERDDAFPNGAPGGFDNHDPIALAREMLESGMALLVLACEPTLSEYYYYATDFYKAVTKIAAGAMYPLTDPKLLSAYIIGSVLEGVELQEKSMQYQENLARRFFVDKEPMDKIIKDLHAEMRAAQQKVTTVAAPTIYKTSPESDYNVKAFASSETLAEARSKRLKRVLGRRFTPSYFESTMSTSASMEDFSSLKITVKNTGSDLIKMKTYDSNEQKLSERVIVNNFTYLVDFFLNRPYNFILECGRATKTFSRTFTNAKEEIDVQTIFSLS
ncbi:hypothetical protein EW145_g3230 [Phellinidium pouzarii]|uniref:VWFA domain-containing protein n=1 Tax=Phellinidium pouzarii TaxID=167371 RepID=A0A4S4L9T6_9AGAM|nr:hypothetical protein EW145_g3230 [Phellinidium pouzarii]